MGHHRFESSHTSLRSPRSVFHTIAAVFLLLQAGCGATQLGMCAPHTKEGGIPTQNWTECFEHPFTHGNITHSVFCLNEGTSKPPVLLLHELTGLTPGTLAYAEELSKDFTVYVPLLFGEKEKFSPASGLRAYWGSSEWEGPQEGSMPIVNWLRGVVQKIGAQHPQQRIGIIGNCMTGPLPVALLDDSQVGAAVVAQPALPMSFWWSTDADRQSLGLSANDLQGARASIAKIYGLRFETDCMADPAKLRTLRTEFGERFINGEIATPEYQLDGKPTNVHSTLIGSWKEHDPAGQASRKARAKVRTFLLTELGGVHPKR